MFIKNIFNVKNYKGLEDGFKVEFDEITYIVGDNAREKDDFNNFLKDIVLDYPKIIKIQSNALTAARNNL